MFNRNPKNNPLSPFSAPLLPKIDVLEKQYQKELSSFLFPLNEKTTPHGNYVLNYQQKRYTATQLRKQLLDRLPKDNFCIGFIDDLHPYKKFYQHLQPNKDVNPLPSVNEISINNFDPTKLNKNHIDLFSWNSLHALVIFVDNPQNLISISHSINDFIHSLSPREKFRASVFAWNHNIKMLPLIFVVTPKKKHALMQEVITTLDINIFEILPLEYIDNNYVGHLLEKEFTLFSTSYSKNYNPYITFFPKFHFRDYNPYDLGNWKFLQNKIQHRLVEYIPQSIWQELLRPKKPDYSCNLL